ncbi:NUDIX domain-containing protein [Desulfonema ishimotonii]|uniref:NUDIX domain-containing protein n=1 Tax=Desulfonema ishimotonii TaxID=45657 RepID=A0A401FYL7_9BACT|nr:NUDIX hydrolase [Desulfonema ishimotonii]GBC62061.1 NUDIX domain-containing protein [Desulfonema ishimotonii]
MKEPMIRPIALCVFRHKNRILVFEGYDPVKEEVFYRPLGGGIEFGEHSSEAVVREIREELGAPICNISFLGSIENIFTFDGKPGHEIVQIYDAQFCDAFFYEQEYFEAFNDRGERFKALWMDLELFKDESAPLYPDGLLEMLWGEMADAARGMKQ